MKRKALALEGRLPLEGDLVLHDVKGSFSAKKLLFHWSSGGFSVGGLVNLPPLTGSAAACLLSSISLVLAMSPFRVAIQNELIHTAEIFLSFDGSRFCIVFINFL